MCVVCACVRACVRACMCVCVCVCVCAQNLNAPEMFFLIKKRVKSVICCFRMAFVQIIQKPHEPLLVPLNDQGHLPKAQVKAIDSRTTGLIYRLEKGGYV